MTQECIELFGGPGDGMIVPGDYRDIVVRFPHVVRSGFEVVAYESEYQLKRTQRGRLVFVFDRTWLVRGL